MKRRIDVYTVLLLLAAALVASAWVISTPDFEPVVTFLLVIATIVGVFVDRWLNERDKRRALLHGLAHEILVCVRIVGAMRRSLTPAEAATYHVYDRFPMTAAITAIASGAFAGGKDKVLFNQLHGWLSAADSINHRLHITELRMLLEPADVATIRTRVAGGKTIASAFERLEELGATLFDNYSAESGIKRDTVLFSDAREDHEDD